MFLGIDLGTSAVKVVAWSDGAILGQQSVGLDVSSPRPGWSEQDPAAWIAATRIATKRVLERVDSDGVQGIGLSGQMHGAVILDSMKSPLRPCILWNDSRATDACAQMQARAPEVAQLAGVPPLPGFTAPKIAWLKHNERETYARLHHILLPKDYVGLWLHGELATDRGDAAGTLWFDQAAGAWSPALCAASDTDIDWLPPVYSGTAQVGQLRREVAQELGLPAGVPVFAGGADAAAGAVSVGAIRPGRGFISLGTSAQLFLCTDQHRPNPEKFVHAFAHTLPGLHYQMAAMLNGARPMAWWADVQGLSVPDMIALAEGADTHRAPICLPYLSGERSPHGDPHIRGAFIGLENSTTRAEMAYAVIEAIAFSMADACESFGAGLKQAPHLLAIGGGARSDFLLALIARMTGRTLGRADKAEAGPALGAAMLAARGAGALNADELAEPPDITTWFEPTDPGDMARDRLTLYRNSYAALAPLHRP